MTNDSIVARQEPIRLAPEFKSPAEQTQDKRDNGLTFSQLAVLLVDCGKCLVPVGEVCTNGGAHANRIRRLKTLRRGEPLKPIRSAR